MNYLVEDVELLTSAAVHFDTGIYCEHCTLSIVYLVGSGSPDIES